MLSTEYLQRACMFSGQKRISNKLNVQVSAGSSWKLISMHRCLQSLKALYPQARSPHRNRFKVSDRRARTTHTRDEQSKSSACLGNNLQRESVSDWRAEGITRFTRDQSPSDYRAPIQPCLVSNDAWRSKREREWREMER